MDRRLPVALCLVLLLVPAAGAAALDIPLPELAGQYGSFWDPLHAATVEFHPPARGVAAVSISLAGTITPGTARYWNQDTGRYESLPIVAMYVAYLTLSDGVSRLRAWSGTHDGSFEEECRFVGVDGAGLDSPLRGPIQLELDLAVGLLPGDGEVVSWPRARIDAAVLRLSTTVPVQETTWGRVKALYD